MCDLYCDNDGGIDNNHSIMSTTYQIKDQTQKDTILAGKSSFIVSDMEVYSVA